MTTELLIAGVDEVGRGPLAGPVVAAAVILDPDNTPEGLADSKKLSEKKRQTLAEQIKDSAQAWCLGRAEFYEIDTLNILQASLVAMKRAIEGLSVQPQHVQVDGNRIPDIDISAEAIIKGDSKVAAISAASILAKVARDNEMLAMDNEYPGYGFAKHKGYPTREHLQALQEQGVCAIHRLSFAPVRACMANTHRD